MTSRMRQIANQTLKTVITLFEKLYAKYKQFKLHILVIPLYVIMNIPRHPLSAETEVRLDGSIFTELLSHQ